ncbi:MAG: hypothetical protein ACFFC7_11610 [Candidatus Hermodarchaeota archaeon]
MPEKCPDDSYELILRYEESNIDIGGLTNIIEVLYCEKCDHFIVKKISQSPRRTLATITFQVIDESKTEEVYELLKAGKRVYYDNKTVILVKKEGMTYAGW